ncbi:MAG: GNAT family N-acetyltransferase [Oscillospiraceae bacterium]|nr:GNAT family N-acetyltransferase [Oscillospiraceae bacterium]
MNHWKQTTTKDNKTLILRNAEKEDAEAYLEYFHIAHSETDFLTSYPDESQHDIHAVSNRLEETKQKNTALELCAFVDGKLIASAGFDVVKNRAKTRHRANFGISVVKEYWGMGIGTELTKTCVALAKKAGYLQLELEVVADNVAAVRLYQKVGFVEYGRNPKAFRTRQGQWQEVISMRLEL